MSFRDCSLNGMEAARRIRQQDRKVIIIFITNLAQFAIQGYEVEALSYVLKPINYFAFSQELKKAVRKIQEQETFFLYLPVENGIFRLDVSRITFAESQGHNIIYHTCDGQDFRIRDSMKNVEKKLEGHNFYRCNSGYLVNLQKVERVEKNDVTVGGIVLSISRTRRKGFMEELARFVGGG